MTSRILLIISILLPCPNNCRAGDVEESRVYGKAFVGAIGVGQSPPVCVTEYVCGPRPKQDFTTMRNPDRPSIQIFAKDVDSVESPIFTAIDASTVRLKIPLFVVLTLPKGISGGSTEDFDPKHYLQKEETAALANKLKERVSDLKLENATVGIAVNRFWRDSIGYENQANVIIAYVRKDVIYLKQIDVSKLDNRTVEQTVEMIQKLHHESTGGP